MVNQISANISSIFELDNGLTRTISEVDMVIYENEELIRNTQKKISDALEDSKIKKNKAYQKLIEAQNALAEVQASHNQGAIDISFYYKTVADCENDYNNFCRIYSSIEKIYNIFTMSVSSYNQKIDTARQKYVTLIKKSSHILSQYGELLQKSKSTITGTVNNGRFISTNPAENNSSSRSSLSLQQATYSNQPEILELLQTNQAWKIEADGSMIFNTPVETGIKLDSNQGKDPNYQGTCGLVSCVNVLRLAGYPVTEKELVDYASSTLDDDGERLLCVTDSLPKANGGTSAIGRQQILRHFGIKSELQAANITNIATAVSEGKGVIISVFARMLYFGETDKKDSHAITVTSVKKDVNGNICGFYVCDSGTGGVDNSKYYTKSQIERALTGRPSNVTFIIR